MFLIDCLLVFVFPASSTASSAFLVWMKEMFNNNAAEVCSVLVWKKIFTSQNTTWFNLSSGYNQESFDWERHYCDVTFSLVSGLYQRASGSNHSQAGPNLFGFFVCLFSSSVTGRYHCDMPENIWPQSLKQLIITCAFSTPSGGNHWPVPGSSQELVRNNISHTPSGMKGLHH